MPRGDDAGGGVQVARAGVVAEPLPCLQHIVQRGGGQRPDIGPALEEPVEIRAGRRGHGLLQHDLAEPDAVGLRALARRRAPRQFAAMRVVPRKQCLRRRLHRLPFTPSPRPVHHTVRTAAGFTR